MNTTVPAHYDGEQVVLDEAAPFVRGESLLVASCDPAATRPTPLSIPHVVAGEWAGRFDLAAFLAGVPPAEPGEPDLNTFVLEDRRQRRAWARECADDEFAS